MSSYHIVYNNPRTPRRWRQLGWRQLVSFHDPKAVATKEETIIKNPGHIHCSQVSLADNKLDLQRGNFVKKIGKIWQIHRHSPKIF